MDEILVLIGVVGIVLFGFSERKIYRLNKYDTAVSNAVKFPFMVACCMLLAAGTNAYLANPFATLIANYIVVALGVGAAIALGEVMDGRSGGFGEVDWFWVTIISGGWPIFLVIQLVILYRWTRNKVPPELYR